MESSADTFEFRSGDRVVLASDDWTTLGHDLVLVDPEPVSGSTQCLVRDGAEVRVVSRFALRQP